MDDVTVNAGTAPRTVASVLDRLERLYLNAIRGLALLGATVLILFALWMAISGVFKASKDVASVQVAPAIVSAAEVARVDTARLADAGENKAPDPLATQRRFYTGFNARYHALFRDRFEPFRQASDRRLDAKAFDGRFLRTADRLTGIGEGDLDFAQDKADLEALLGIMTDVAAGKPAKDRLTSYRDARKVKVSRTISGTRPERYCSYYGYFIDQCITYDTRDVPFSRKVEELRLPAGVVSHTDLFGAYQDRFITMTTDRRRENEATAQAARAQILADNAEGGDRLWTAIKVVGAFVVLMFLFLLIAMERHQRRIAHAEMVRSDDMAPA